MAGAMCACPEGYSEINSKCVGKYHYLVKSSNFYIDLLCKNCCKYFQLNFILQLSASKF